MSKHYDKEIKENAVRYYKEHNELNLKKCSENLGIVTSTRGNWIRKTEVNNGKVPTRSSSNYSRNSYYSFKHRNPSTKQLHKEIFEDKIVNIYHESHKNYVKSERK